MLFEMEREDGGDGWGGFLSSSCLCHTCTVYIIVPTLLKCVRACLRVCVCCACVKTAHYHTLWVIKTNCYCITHLRNALCVNVNCVCRGLVCLLARASRAHVKRTRSRSSCARSPLRPKDLWAGSVVRKEPHTGAVLRGAWFMCDGMCGGVCCGLVGRARLVWLTVGCGTTLVMKAHERVRRFHRHLRASTSARQLPCAQAF